MRLDELTALRGVAALAVVVLHARDDWNVVFATGARFTCIILSGGVWVHFFFMLSGFVIASAYARDFVQTLTLRGYARFMWLRFGRIYPLYVSMLLLWVVLEHVHVIKVSDPPGSLTASFLLMQGVVYGDDVWNYPGWSISAEMFAYLSFPVIALWYARLSNRTHAWLAAALIVATLSLWGIAIPTNELPALSIVFCLLEFCLGMSVHRYTTRQRFHIPNPRFAAGLALIPIVLLALPPSTASVWIMGLASVSCLLTIGIVATQRTSLDRLLRSPVAQFMGIISYSIYLDHALLFRGMKAVADFVTGKNRYIQTLAPVPALISFVVYLGLLILVSWCTYRWIEEPVRLWFKRVGASRRMAVSRPSSI